MPDIVKKSTSQKVAEAAVESFRKDLGPFVVAGETTRMAMVFTDAREADNPIIFANDAFLSLTGYDRKEILGQSLTPSGGAGRSRRIPGAPKLCGVDHRQDAA
jgi:PAS domain-containing protein